jgi:predicted ATPase/class 3 adenylate cyclase
MHPLIPEFILKHYALGNTSGTFSAAGLFVDISGFSTMTDQLMEHGQHGAEIMAEVMRTVFEPLIQSVYEQGGFVVAMSGDAFTALFPTETNSTQAIHRALSAAWDIRTESAAKSRIQTVYGEFSITIKVGLAMGETSWGIITSEDEKRAAYFFQGSAVDGCSEAEHHARPGEIVVNNRLFHQIGDEALFELVEGFYRLVGLSFDPSPPNPIKLPEPYLDLASRFYPRDLYLQQYSGEFRRCTSLFVRLPTIRTEAQLRIFMQTVFSLQDQYGGLLELRFGDKGAHLMLIWGAPISHENDVERAINFILELQTRTTIPLNAGMTYRIAHAGFIGSDLAEEFTVYGRGGNLAARFMTTASRGEIWVDENVVNKAAHLFEFEYGGQQQFKGLARPQKYYILIERKELDENDSSGELVGRDREKQILHAFAQPLFSNHFAGMMIVKGEAGIGKSRLLHSFMDYLGNEHPGKIQVFLAQTDEILRQPFNPFRYWLHRYFDVNDAQSDARNKRNFNRKLDDLIHETKKPVVAEELDRTRSFLGALVGLFWPDSLHEQVEARDRYENTLAALNTLFQAESSRKPVVLLIEDIHWLDEDSQRYLPVLLRSMFAEDPKSFPFAVLASSRLGETYANSEGFHIQEIELSQLNREALTALTASILQNRPSEDLLDLLVQRSEGNPFFAGELLRYLDRNNLLDCRPDGCLVVSDQTKTLPDNIEALLIALLDHLPPEVKDVVQTAAVLGREFDVNVLAYMLMRPDLLKDKIRQAQEAAVWLALSEIRYIFRHNLMRDAAYSMLIMSRRKELHRIAVKAIETVYGRHLSVHYAELAHHATLAEQPDKARRFYRWAGEAARDAYQNLLALEYFSHAITFSTGIPAERFDLLLECIKLYDRLGMIEARKDTINKMGQLTEQMDDPHREAIFLLEMSNFDLDTDSYNSAILSARKAAALAERAGNDKETSIGYRYIGIALFRQGKFRQAIDHLQVALEHSHTDDSDKADALNNLGLVFLDQEKLDLSVEAFSQALEIAKKNNNLIKQIGYLNNLAQTIGLSGDLFRSKNYFEQSLELIKKTGTRRDEGLVLGNLGWIAGQIGDYQTAKLYHLRSLEINRQVGQPYTEAYIMINLGATATALGDYQEAVHWAEDALALNSTINNRNIEAWAFTYLGHAHLALGHLVEAEQAYQSAVGLRIELEQHVMAAEPLAGLAQTAFLQGQTSDAKDYIKPVLLLIDSGSSFEGTDEPLRIYSACYLVLTAMKDDRAGDVLEKGYKVLQSRAKLISDDTIRIHFLETIPHHRYLHEAWINKNRPVEAGPV